MKMFPITAKRRCFAVAFCAFSTLAAGSLPAAAVTSSDPADAAGSPVEAAAPAVAATPAASTKQSSTKPRQKVSALPAAPAAGAAPSTSTAAATTGAIAATTVAAPGTSEAVASGSAPGPYYVDFRARTAASYGHAFIWYGKSTERAVEVAGLHPATDSPVPYVLGHLMFVPSETGASYGDLDEQYLTANYRVYMTAEDAPKVIAYIQKLQKSTPYWNATTTNCTWFIGQIASFMGLKTPLNVFLPEEYVNELKKMNNGRNMAKLSGK